MSNTTAMQDVLIDYIRREHLQHDSSIQLDPETDLLLSGLLDSMGVMRLVGFIETQFAISIPPQDVTIDHFVNAQTIAVYISGRQAASLESSP